MSGMGERISVCLLTYNHVAVVESTIQSILTQSIGGYQVVVSDDCSDDGTWEAIQKIAAANPAVKAIRTPKNLGMPGNANFAVANSDRPYIALLHHDDLYRTDLLQKWAEVLERHSEVSFVFNPYGIFGNTDRSEEPMPGEVISGVWLLERYLFPRWGCVVRGTAMIRRSAWEKAGGMRERFGLLADIDLWMRLSMQSDVGYVREPVITIRQQRPSYYPDIYSGRIWSWRRQRLLYEIHGANRAEFHGSGNGSDVWAQFVFRTRLSVETAKWLIYAVVRRKTNMIDSCLESITPYDQPWLRVLRALIRWFAATAPEPRAA